MRTKKEKGFNLSIDLIKRQIDLMEDVLVEYNSDVLYCKGLRKDIKQYERAIKILEETK